MWQGPLFDPRESFCCTVRDTCSSCNDLHLQEHQKLVRALQQAQEDTGMLSASTAALEAAAAAATAKMAAEVLAVRRMQARAMQARVLDGGAAQRAHPARLVVRRMHHINQPRRMN
jgi:hypothetical protein